MIPNTVTYEEVLTIRAMYGRDPELYTEFNNERYYGWVLFDEEHEMIDIKDWNDMEVADAFYQVGHLDG